MFFSLPFQPHFLSLFKKKEKEKKRIQGSCLEPSSYLDSPVRQESQLPPRNHTPWPQPSLLPTALSCPLCQSQAFLETPGGQDPLGLMQVHNPGSGGPALKNRAGRPNRRPASRGGEVSTVLKAWAVPENTRLLQNEGGGGGCSTTTMSSKAASAEHQTSEARACGPRTAARRTPRQLMAAERS